MIQITDVKLINGKYIFIEEEYKTYIYDPRCMTRDEGHVFYGHCTPTTIIRAVENLDKINVIETKLTYQNGKEILIKWSSEIEIDTDENNTKAKEQEEG